VSDRQTHIYYGRATRNHQKWLSGTGDFPLCSISKTSVHLPVQQVKNMKHKWFHVFGSRTTVNLNVTAVFISHWLQAQTHKTWQTWSDSVYVKQKQFLAIAKCACSSSLSRPSHQFLATSRGASIIQALLVDYGKNTDCALCEQGTDETIWTWEVCRDTMLQEGGWWRALWSVELAY
jgi:hypothetical protein